MKTTYPRRTFALLLTIGAASVGLCAAGCHQGAPPPPPLPVGVAKVDSSKPPPGMEALYQRSQAAKSAASGQQGGTAGR